MRKWASGAENPIDLFEAVASVRPDGQFHCEIGVATAGSAIAPIVVLIQPSPKKQGPPLRFSVVWFVGSGRASLCSTEVLGGPCFLGEGWIKTTIGAIALPAVATPISQ